jgi:type IV pilus assembly protein PilM
MAKTGAVWGIDIGQAALKALRCRPHEKEPRRLVVEAFDYIEYPKILTQPEAEPAEIVREALATFLSRNEIVGDEIAISVPGQSGLARFIKLPPVESKKIPDIVKYEARQQIPFSLDDVVWDYQQLTGGSEDDGFAIEPEVGLFAMKRDQVARSLAPLEEAGIEVDLIQLAPLAVYNYVCFDRMEELASRPFDPAKPPASTVVISLGADTTDLVVTNGFRVWQRNIPIGGNHFTRALSKELKLTFVKAEHLKRNATQADDPKAVFQAMRPVFSDLLAEIQRSLGYFQSLDKSAHIGEVIALGNAMKLPGLQRYLAQNLEQEVKPIEDFNRLVAGSAGGAAQFKENILSFAPAYGLCVQGLGKAELKTNLLPEEIIRRRLVRSKKPWAVLAAAAVLLGLLVNYFTHVSSWRSADVTREDFASAITQATNVQGNTGRLDGERTEILEQAKKLQELQTNLTSNVEGRLRWLELVKAIDAALPVEERPREENAKHVMSRNELHITALDGRKFTDLVAEYVTPTEAMYVDSPGQGGSAAAAPAAGDFPDPNAPPPTEETSLDGAAPVGGVAAGPGWVIQLTGYHYHNSDEDKQNQSATFVVNTLLKQLADGTVKLPDGYDAEAKKPTGKMVDVKIEDLGISRAWILPSRAWQDEWINPDEELGLAGGTGLEAFMPQPGMPEGGVPGEEKPSAFKVRKFDFVVQFCWQPRTRAERRAIVEERTKAEEAAAAAAEAAASEETPVQ